MIKGLQPSCCSLSFTCPPWASLPKKMLCTQIVIPSNFFLHYLSMVLLLLAKLVPTPPPLGCFLRLHLHKTYDLLHDISVKIDKW
jgi:hypothetical protein